MKVYVCHSDAGHGWLAVKREELVRLGIADKISQFSYQRGKTVYIEEDSDAAIFMNAKKERGEPVEQRISKFKGDVSPIRNYDRYFYVE